MSWVFSIQNLFLKKFEFVPHNLIYYTTDVFTYQFSCGEFVYIHLFLSVRISFYSWSPLRIFSFCENLYFFIYDQLWESFWILLISENLFLFIVICGNLFYLWSFLGISFIKYFFYRKFETHFLREQFINLAERTRLKPLRQNFDHYLKSHNMVKLVSVFSTQTLFCRLLSQYIVNKNTNDFVFGFLIRILLI